MPRTPSNQPGPEQLGEHPVEPVERPRRRPRAPRSRRLGRAEVARARPRRRAARGCRRPARPRPVPGPAPRPAPGSASVAVPRGRTASCAGARATPSSPAPRLVTTGPWIVESAEPRAERLVQRGHVGEPDQHLRARPPRARPSRAGRPSAGRRTRRARRTPPPRPGRTRRAIRSRGARGVVGREVVERLVPARARAGQHAHVEPPGAEHGEPRRRGGPSGTGPAGATTATRVPGAQPACPDQRPARAASARAPPPSGGAGPAPCRRRISSRLDTGVGPGRDHRRRSARPGCRSGPGRSRAAGSPATPRTGAAPRRTSSLARCDHIRPCPGELGGSISRVIRRTASSVGPARGRPRRRAASATSGRAPRRRTPWSTSRRAGPTEPTWNCRTPARTSHGTCSPRSPPPAISSRATSGSAAARSVSSSRPASSPRGGAGGEHRVEAGQAGDLAPGAVGLQRGVDRAVERPRHAGQPVGEVAAHLDVDLEVGVEEAERHALRADGEVVLGEPDQPGQLAAGGGQAVVEPEHHPHRELGLAADARHQRRAPATARRPRRRRPGRAGRRRPRRRPATSRGCSTTTSSSARRVPAWPGTLTACSQWTS